MQQKRVFRAEDLTRKQLEKIVGAVQSALYLEPGEGGEPSRFDPEKEWNSETAQIIANAIHNWAPELVPEESPA